MVNYYRVQSKFFIVFLAISAMAFSAIPFVRKAFGEASENYVVQRMHYVQAEMYLNDLSRDNLHLFCAQGSVVGLQFELIDEIDSSLVCTIDKKNKSIAFYTSFDRNSRYYCVDTLGYQGYLDQAPDASGHCSK